MILSFPSPLEVLGIGLRLPGADNIQEFWSLLEQGRSSVQDISPAGRWRPELFLSPDPLARGTTYTFAGGYLDQGMLFDAAAFGISRREAEQMDPQQRLLLEVTWEALEDAGIAPASLSGRRIGVYMGASSTDYGDVPMLDIGAVDSHFMTGNSLAMVSNRVSYAFDLKGPSLTIDTACSSSVVALAQAAAALRDGLIEFAIVGGVNFLASPAPFIGFSRAGMLSPTGRCRPFSAQADGYVRSEGGVAMILARAGESIGAMRPRAVLHAIGVNSDGRTNGIALPSLTGQRDLLEALYRQAGIAPDALAFIEAHGTGTRVGDPIEANAIGEALGRHRREALPIGSVKSNIGHLESASGMAGLAKLVLSLERRHYPATLYLEEINPDIDVAALGLAPAAAAIDLAASGPLLAGLCNYGFGGTNAHAILGSAEPRTAPAAPPAPSRFLVISAHSKAALRQLAAAHVAPIHTAGAASVATEIRLTRDRLPHRFAMDLALGGDAAEALSHLDSARPDAAMGEAIARQARIAFVFSGNGSQWPGMGRMAYGHNATFRAVFDDLAAGIREAGGVCPLETMEAEDVALRLAATSAVQPLLFTIQVSLCAALAAQGLTPDIVLGHSVGEVAAAAVSGALSMADAVQLIVQRSAHQEPVRGLGGMAVLGCDAERAARILAEVGAESDGAMLDIAAINSPSSTTISGDAEALGDVLRAARKARIATVMLDIDYPFHSRALDPEKAATLTVLAALRPRAAHIPFVSGVTGSKLAGEALDAAYWWANIRETIRFQQATQTALPEADLFIEIGPRPILTSLLMESARHTSARVAVMGTLSQGQKSDPADPMPRILLEALIKGAPIDLDQDAAPPGERLLPMMQWDRQFYLINLTHGAYTIYGSPLNEPPLHPLTGPRLMPGGPEWRQIFSIETLPFLSGHRVDGEVIIPATAYIEMILGVGREVHGTGRLRIVDLDILRPMGLEPRHAREVSITWNEADRAVEIRSRPRFEPVNAFILHARAVVLRETVPAPPPPELPPGGVTHDEASIYAAAERCRLAYSGAFRVARSARVIGDLTITELAPEAIDLGFFANTLVADPTSYDAAFHGIFLGVGQKPGQVVGELPIRVGRVSLFRPGIPIARSVARLVRQTADARVFDIDGFAADGELIGHVGGVVMRRLLFASWRESDRIVETHRQPWQAGPKDLTNRLTALMSAEAREAPAPAALRQDLVRLAGDIGAQIVGNLAGDRFSALDPSLDGRIAPEARVVWRALIDSLCELGRITEREEHFLLATPPAPQAADTALTTFLHDHPGASADLRLAAIAMEALPALLTGGDVTLPSPELLAGLDASSSFAAPSHAALVEMIEALAGPEERPRLRVVLLEPGLGGLLERLLPLARAGRLSLSMLSADQAAGEKLLARLDARNLVALLDPDSRQDGAGPDLAVCAGVTPLDGGERSALDLLIGLGDAAPPLLAAIPAHDPAIDILHAALPGWFRFSLAPEMPVGAWPYPSETNEALASRGFAIRGVRQVGHDDSRIVLAVRPRRVGREPASSRQPLCLTGCASAAQEMLWDILPSFELMPAESAEAAAAMVPALLGSLEQAVVLDWGAPGGPADAAEFLAERMLRLRDLAIALSDGGTACRLYVVVQDRADAASQAMAAFVRCLMNEFAALDVCLIRAEAAADLDAALRRHLAQPVIERELLVGAERIEVPRAMRQVTNPARARETGEKTRLQVGMRGLDELNWVLVPRDAPAAGEVEVEVTATGVNFRDVMLGLGVLDAEILGAGLTSGALGFELAGRVVRVGEGVVGLLPGDGVMGFAAQAFASHVTLPAAQLFPCGDDVSLETAASIPVAFITAWYGLIERGGLRRGETVLIQGAAGGVGMAALQVAKAHGAVVVAAAGTAEKRALLRRLGADVVVDSRSADFEEAVLAATGGTETGGVDLVLNSVAGDAMRAALRLVKPFGRFVELGKRDFMDNTRVGLRPFVKNVTYIGADLDQLLAHDPALIRRMVGAVMTLFEASRLAPIPHLALEGARVADAFRLMQSSAHIGKILVRPSPLGLPVAPAGAVFVPADGVHVVLGGAGGFGLETALWLAAQGARSVMVASRRGEIEPAMAERVAQAQAAGTDFRVERLDITQAEDVAAAFARWRQEFGGIAGIIHTAMVLEDGLILGLTAEKIARVLEPKVTGIRAIEAALRGDQLQYLVAYSSSTTFVGSPGQSAYVVGNAFLEGAVLEMRRRGLPALAVCWGAISDVGVIARTRGLAERLRAATGVSGVSSAEALGYLGRLIAAPFDAPAVSAYTVIRWTPAANKLAVLRSPYFAEVFAEAGTNTDASGVDMLDLAALSEEEAAAALLELVRGEVARILRLPPDAIELDRPLIDIGLDSLMALELRMAMEKRVGLELPLTGMGGHRSIRDLTDRMIQMLPSRRSH